MHYIKKHPLQKPKTMGMVVFWFGESCYDRSVTRSGARFNTKKHGSCPVSPTPYSYNGRSTDAKLGHNLTDVSSTHWVFWVFWVFRTSDTFT